MFLNDLGQDKTPVVLLSGITNLLSVAEMVGTPYVLQKPYDLDSVVDWSLKRCANGGLW